MFDDGQGTVPCVTCHHGNLTVTVPIVTIFVTLDTTARLGAVGIGNKAALVGVDPGNAVDMATIRSGNECINPLWTKW